MKKVRKVVRQPRWKRVATEIKKKTRNKWVRKVFRFLLVMTVVVVVGWGIREVVSSRWDGKSRVNVVLALPSVYLVSYDSGSQAAMVVELPDNLMVKAAYGYGEYRAGALAGLDRQEKKKGKLVEDSVADYLGVFTEGNVIRIKNQESPKSFAMGQAKITNKADLLQLLLRIVAGRLVGKKETNLSVWDVFRLWRAVVRVREDKLEIIDLSQTMAVNEATLPDGSLSYAIDEQRLTALSERWFVDEALVKEELPVMVVNTTGGFGLGGRLARMLKVLGAQVVAVEDEAGDLDRSLIKVEDRALTNKATLRKLRKFLGVEVQVDNRLRQERARVIVYLGRDYRVRLFGD